MALEITTVAYLKQQLGANKPLAEYMAEWRKLTDTDKTDLHRWAEIEMKALGITVKPRENKDH